METELVVAGKATAIAASPDRLYVSNNNAIRIYNRYESFEQERVVRSPAKQIVYDETAQCVGYLTHSRAFIYSADLRKQLYEFDSGSAAILAAHGGTFVLASKRRLRWTKRAANGQWTSGNLAIAGVTALDIKDGIVYAASSDHILAVDLTARVVRQLGIKLPKGWSASHKICFSDALVVVSGTKGWYNLQEFNLKEAPLAIASLGKFWLCGYKTRIDLYYGTVVAYTIHLNTTFLSNDAFVSCDDGVYQLKPKITAEFVASLALEHPDFALSLAEDLDDPRINELRQKRAQVFLEEGHWNRALKLLQQARMEPESVISEIQPFFDKLSVAESPNTARAMAPSGSFSASDASPVYTSSSSASIVSHASARDRLVIPQVEAYIPYLTSQRRRLHIQLAGGSISETQAKTTLRCIDNALFNCYFVNKSSLVGALVRNSNCCDADLVVPKLKSLGRWRDLVGFLHSREMHTEALELLADQGSIQDTAAYLEQTDSWDLVQKFGPPVIKDSPELAEQLFSGNGYDSHQVYDFLVSNSSPYALKYLQEQVSISTDPALHQELAAYYLDHNMTDELDEFLKTSDMYRPQELLPKIPQNLYHSRAILYSKMGRHDKVIQIFVEHNNIAEARDYCLETLEQNYSAGKLALTHLYEDIKKQPQELIHFVNSLGHHLDYKRILDDIPAHTNMQDIAAFFANQSKQSRGNLSISRLTKALEQVYLSESTYDLAHLRDEGIEVHSTSTCAYCKKRLGLSVLGVWKGFVLHYGCIDAYKSIY